MAGGRIVVVGSLNIDLVFRVDRLPAPGETVRAGGQEEFFGGKGANQAVAASRLGAEVAMVGRLGDDEAGKRYLERLAGMGIGTRGVEPCAGLRSGAALIAVDASGENTIIVAGGANGAMDPGYVRARPAAFEGAGALLVQNEIPHAANAAAAELARAAGALVIYNPAPWDPAREIAVLRPDVIVVNEAEDGGLGDYQFDGIKVVTRGAVPTVAHAGGASFEVEPPAVTPVDTVGAGDTFVAALACCLVGSAPLADAVDFANRAAALATTKPGAQEAMPSLDELG